MGGDPTVRSWGSSLMRIGLMSGSIQVHWPMSKNPDLPMRALRCMMVHDIFSEHLVLRI